MDGAAEYSPKLLQWPDYLIFGLMLMISALIGIYYACTAKKQNTTAEFLMGGRKMRTFPVAMSLLASFLSAFTLLGLPAEVYFFGTQISVIVAVFFFVMPVSSYLYMPIFYRLQLTSAYEYLELRFNRTVRSVCSALFTVQMMFYLSIVVYAPALALSQVTGVDVYVSVSTTVLVCVFYTVLGGMKAVVWTDALQVIFMYGSVLVIIIKGTIDAGGPTAVWQANQQSGRIEFFNFDTNLTTRHTFWNLILSQTIAWLSCYGVSQTQIQRYLSIPTIDRVRRAIWINMTGIISIFVICFYAGLIVYARFQNCDPYTAKLISTTDQIFPFFVTETLSSLPGVSGLFVAGVVSASLSTVSSGVNSLAAIALEDFIRPYVLPKMSDKLATRISKAVAVFYGLSCLSLVFLASQIQSIIEAGGTLDGVISGPLLAVFTLGIFCPWTSSAGVLTGLAVGCSFVSWIGFGTLALKGAGQIQPVRKPLSIDGCPYNITDLYNTTTIEQQPTLSPEDDVLAIYKISYAWYSVIGFVLVMITGTVTSLVFKYQDPKRLDPRLICNLGETVFWFMPKKFKEFWKFKVGDDYVQRAAGDFGGSGNVADGNPAADETRKF